MTLNPSPSNNSARQYLAVYLSVGISAFSMNWLSLHGVDFKVFGVPSEVVKATIESHLVLFFMWLSADHIVESAVGSLIWIRISWRKIIAAATGPLQAMMKPPEE